MKDFIKKYKKILLTGIIAIFIGFPSVNCMGYNPQIDTINTINPIGGKLTVNGDFNVTGSMTTTSSNQFSVYLSPTNSLAYVGTGTMLGSGTIMSPYYGDFDYIMTRQPDYVTFHLMGLGSNQPFYTMGWMPGNSGPTNIQLKTSWQLIGEGESKTFIKRDPTRIFNGGYILFGTNGGNVIHDLTVDCNITNQFTVDNKSCSGVNLQESYNKVFNVTVIN
jgi:hypothetical protein